MATKTTTKKPVKHGIFLRRSAKGISVHVHSSNGNKLAVMTGYNTAAGAHKGLLALNRLLNDCFVHVTGKYRVTDLTKPVKKVKK